MNRWRSAGGVAALGLAWASAVRAQEPPVGARDLLPARIDAEGVPLPPGAIARFGTRAWASGQLIDGVAISPDSRLVATGGHDGSAHLYDAETGREVRTFLGSRGFTSGATFSRGGKQLVAGGLDETIRFWDVESGTQLGTLRAKDATIAELALSTEGTRVAAAWQKGPIRIWDVASKRVVAQCARTAEMLSMLRFSPDGTRLASCGGGAPAQIWDAATGMLVYELGTESPRITAVAWAADGTFLVTAGDGPGLTVWDAATGSVTATHKLWMSRQAHVSGIAFRGSSGELVTAGSDGRLRIFDISVGREVLRLVVPGGGVDHLTVSGDGRLAVVADERAIQVWDLEQGRRRSPRTEIESDLETMVVAPDGRAIIGTTPLRAWDPVTGDVMRFEDSAWGEVRAIAILPDGMTVAAGGFDSVVRLYDLRDGRERRILEGHDTWIASIAPFPDGRRLLVGDYQKRVWLWDLSTGRHVSAPDMADTPHALAIAPDGRWAVASTHGATALWRFGETMTHDRFLKGGGPMALRADGSQLLVGEGFGEIELIETETWTTKTVLDGDAWPGRDDPAREPDGDALGSVSALAWHPAGELAAFGLRTGQVGLVDVPGRKLVSLLDAHRDDVVTVAFDRTGARLYSASADRTVLAWSVEPLQRAGIHVSMPRSATQPPTDWPPPPPPPPEPPPVAPADAARVDGSYVTPIEVRGYHWERLRLDQGRFRYWIQTDVIVRGGPTYPLTGRYTVADDVVTLHHPDLGGAHRTFMIVNGKPVLWRDDGLELWRAEHRVHPYGVLIQVAGQDPNVAIPMSVEVLHDPGLRARLEREYQERFLDMPEPIRTLFRAHTDRDDPDGAKRRTALETARRAMEPALFDQLVAQLGTPESRRSFEAEMLLRELLAGAPWGPPVPFARDDTLRRAALGRLVDALPQARTSLGLESALRAFLCGVGGGEAVISVPDARVAFRVKFVRTDNGFAESSNMGGWLHGDPATDPAAATTLKGAITAAQAWCRDELARRFPPTPAGK